MTIEHTSRGDPARTIELLWGTRERSRGPKPGLTIEGIATTAIAIADTEGLGALSMRRLAARLDVGTMSLYRYVPSKNELLDVMFDHVSGETSRSMNARHGWRRRLEHVARENRRLIERHPWLLQVYAGRPPLGPGVIGKYDHELRAIDGIGLSDVEMDLVLGLVLGYVYGAASNLVESARLPDHTGQTDDEWWNALAPALERVFDPEQFPVAARVGPAASDSYGGASDAEASFEFGLARVLDGIAELVRARRGRRRAVK